MLWWIAETTIVAGVLAVVAALATRFGRLGPASRHAIWLVVILKLVTPPLIRSPWAISLPTTPSSVALADDQESPPVALARLATPRVDPPGIERFEGTEPSPVLETHLDLSILLEALEPSRTLAMSAPVIPTDPPVPLVERPADPFVRPWWTPAAGLIALWLVLSVGMAAVQIARLLRFAHRLRSATMAPAWLEREAEAMADRLGVRTPKALAVDGLGVPLLWCLGRPRLLLPRHLVETLGVDRWRGVLAHELAHLRRGDPWFSRLALLAGWLWWWNPVYVLARRRLDAEAELACDAWVVWALPARGDRVAYAGTMLDICARLRGAEVPAPPLAPALGTSRSGRLLERRIQMILNENATRRLTPPGLLTPAILLLLGLPSWTAARTEDPPAKPTTSSSSSSSSSSTTTKDGKTITVESKVVDGQPSVIVIETDGKGEAKVLQRITDPVQVELKAIDGHSAVVVVTEDDEKDEEGRPTGETKQQRRVIIRRLNVDDAKGKEAIVDAKVALEKAAKAFAEARVKARGKSGDEAKAALDRARAEVREAEANLERVMIATKEAAERDGEKREESSRPLLNLLRKRARESAEKAEAKPHDHDKDAEHEHDKDAETKKGEHRIDIEIRDVDDLSKLFAPDSEAMKALESLGPALSKVLREKFGEGTEFDEKMKSLGGRIEAEVKEKLGPGSEFEQAMKELAKALEDSLGPGSEFEKRMNVFVEEFEARKQAKVQRESEVRERAEKDEAKAKGKAKAKAKPDSEEAERRIVEIQRRIDQLTKELEEVRKAGKRD